MIFILAALFGYCFWHGLTRASQTTRVVLTVLLTVILLGAAAGSFAVFVIVLIACWLVVDYNNGRSGKQMLTRAIGLAVFGVIVAILASISIWLLLVFAVALLVLPPLRRR